MSFVHLHTHSEFSLRDSIAPIEGLVARAAADGQPALALTDHALWGAVAFDRACRQAGLHPIFGLEAYVAPGSRFERAGLGGGDAYDHLVLLAESQTGWASLVALATRAQLEGFHRKPRVDRALLDASPGLIALSGCLGGRLPRLARAGRLEEARAELAWARATFGPDGYFVELQRHAGVPELDALNATLVALAREAGLGLVATNDVHTLTADDGEAHALWLANDQRPPFRGSGYHLATAAEMRARFADLPEAVANTLRIAERCTAVLPTGAQALPCPGRPPELVGAEARAWAHARLAERVEAGLAGRYPGGVPAAAQARAAYELGVFEATGFSAYPLVVADFLAFAARAGIAYTARGSAGGSLALYALGVTSLDPLEHGLVFERFLNPERVAMPDVDIDFAHERRDEVVAHLEATYGRERVSQLATFQRAWPRAALRVVGRALDWQAAGRGAAEARPWRQRADALARTLEALPPQTGFEAAEALPTYRAARDAHPDAARLARLARPLVGLVADVSVHPCGVVVGAEPLAALAPLARTPGGDGRMLQWDADAAGATGLLKLDLLGLDTLSAIDRAGALARARGGPVPARLEDFPTDDPAVYALLGRGETRDVFQLGGPGMARVIAAAQPTSLLGLATLLALYRPGPMEQVDRYLARVRGEEPVPSLHPEVDRVFAPSHGVMVFQEDLLLVARLVAGFALGEADLLRKAMGKKDAALMASRGADFVARAVARGYPRAVAERLWQRMLPFAGYAFNRAHALAYARLGLVTAWLKCHYPAEYLAASATVRQEQSAKVAATLAEARRLGIPVLAPDINRSHLDFTVEDRPDGGPAIRYGLGALRTASGPGLRALLHERAAGGPFATFDELVARVRPRALGRPTLEALAKAGAFDSLGVERAAVASSLDALLASDGPGRPAGQVLLFSTPAPLAPARVPPATPAERLRWEREFAGAYLSGDPLAPVAAQLRRAATALATDLEDLAPGTAVVLGGALAALEERTPRGGGPPSGRGLLLDPSGLAPLRLRARALAALRPRLVLDSLLLLSGTVERPEAAGAPAALAVADARPFETAGAGPPAGAPSLLLACPDPGDAAGRRALFAELGALLAPYRCRGASRLFLLLEAAEGAPLSRQSVGTYPAEDPGLLAALRARFGPRAVRLVAPAPGRHG